MTKLPKLSGFSLHIEKIVESETID